MDSVHELQLAYHSLVRSRQRRHELAALRSLLSQQCLQSRPFWRRLRSRAAELPLALRSTACWEAFLGGVADSGVGDRLALSALAYPMVSDRLDEALEADISQGEVRQPLQRPNNGRASGALGLPAEFLRYAQADSGPGGAPAPAHQLLWALTALIQAVFRLGHLLGGYNVGLIAPIFEQGDELDTGNYRPIAVLEPFVRLYASVLNARIVHYTED